MTAFYFVVWLAGCAINGCAKDLAHRTVGGALISGGSVGFMLTLFACGGHP